MKVGFVIHPHTFGYLRSVLGMPTRTFSSAQSGAANVEEHLWRCGCVAREQSAACDFVACGAHAELAAAAPFDPAGAY